MKNDSCITKDKTDPGILLIRFSSIGDIILTTPLIRSLRESCPDMRIDYLTLPDYKSLLEHNPCIDNLVTIDRRADMAQIIDKARSMRDIQYQYIFDLHRSTRSLLFRMFLNAREKSVLDKHYIKRLILTTFRVSLYKKPYSVVNRYYETARVLNVMPEGKSEIWIDRDKILDAIRLINEISGNKYALKSRVNESPVRIEKGLIKGGKDRIICLMPFAGWETKEWGDYRFIELGRRLARENYLIYILGGEKDAHRAKYIAREIGGIVSFAGRLNLLQTAALLSLSDCLVTGDTGVMHMGDAVLIPVVPIFGSTTEELGFFPLNTDDVIQRPVKCRPCTAKGLHECPRRHLRCMNEISVYEVYSAVIKAIGKFASTKPELLK